MCNDDYGWVSDVILHEHDQTQLNPSLHNDDVAHLWLVHVPTERAVELKEWAIEREAQKLS